MWKPNHPFWQVSLDVMGPLSESNGQKYILLIGYQFSKRYEAVAMANEEAKTVAQALVDNWITQFGCPVNLHSDKGTNFMSELFTKLFRVLGIERTSTTPFHPEGNAMIERTNRTIEESLLKDIDDHQSDWTYYLQLVMLAYCSSIHAVTKHSPNYLVMGTTLRLPIDCMYETRHTELFPTPSDFIYNTKRELQKAHHLVRSHMELEQTRQKTYYDYRAYGPVYHVGEQVLIFFPTVKKGQTKKFTSFYRGPYKILEIINNLKFRVCHEETRKVIKVHYDRMKKYKPRERIFTRMSETQEHTETQQTDESGIIDDDLIEVEIEQTGKLGKRERVANPDETQKVSKTNKGLLRAQAS